MGAERTSRGRQTYDAAMARGTAAYERGRLWVENQDPASRKGATIGWVRRFQAADGQLYAVLLAAYFFLTVLPLLLVYSSYLYSDPHALAKRIETRMSLGGSTRPPQTLPRSSRTLPASGSSRFASSSKPGCASAS